MGPFTLKVPFKYKLIKSQNTTRRPINLLFRNGGTGWMVKQHSFFPPVREFYINIEKIIEDYLMVVVFFCKSSPEDIFPIAFLIEWKG